MSVTFTLCYANQIRRFSAWINAFMTMIPDQACVSLREGLAQDPAIYAQKMWQVPSLVNGISRFLFTCYYVATTGARDRYFIQAS